jgi:photosystem II stability/assembly factor-like uncharacterized protein
MKKHWLGLLVAFALSTLGLFMLFGLTNRNTDLSAAPLAADPTVSEVTPASAINDSETPLVITGTGFSAALSGTEVLTPPLVLLDSTALLDVGWVASTTLTATVPVGFPVGVYTVTVENPNGSSDALPDALTVRYPTPGIEVVSPVSGTYGQAQLLTVTGTHFVPTPTVSLGSVPCPAVGFVSSTTLTVTVPGALLPGIHDLTVHNPGPEAPHDQLLDAFTLYSPEPTVTGIEPIEGPNDLDVAVIITGTGFAPTPEAALAEIPLADVTWISDTRLTAQVPWGMDPAPYALTVTNPAPNAPTASLTNAFTVTPAIGTWNASELYGGTVSDILIHPDQPETLYAEVQDIGLFRSDNGGDDWDFKFAPTADNVALDPADPERLYLFGQSHQAYQPLWRSDDGGDAWTPLTITFPAADMSDCMDHLKPYPITGTLYVGSACGLMRSPDQGENWEPAMGNLTDKAVTDLAFHPTDPQTMYLGTVNGNIFISHDGGDSWTFASQPVGRVHELDVNPFGAHEVWVAAESFYGDPPGAFKSTNADLTAWESIAPPGGVDIIDDFFTFAPRTWGAAYASTVYAASGYTTTDGGASWSSFGPEHDVVFAFTPHPTDTHTVYAGTGGQGIYQTTDSGANWQVANQGLMGIVPDYLEPVPEQPDMLYAIDQWGNGTYQATHGGAVWQALPDASSLLVDPFTTTRVYAGGQDGILRISVDQGQTWPTSVRIVPEPSSGEGYDVPVLQAHPQQAGELLAGLTHMSDGYDAWTGELHRSTDGGETWSPSHIGQVISPVQDIAYDPLDPTLVYAATGVSGLFKSTYSGASWTSLDVPQVTAVEVEPGSHRVYIPSHEVCGGVGSGLCVSHDGGEHWDPTLGVLGGGDVFIFASKTPPILYAATPDGLKKSDNRGQSWTAAAGTLGEVPVYAVAAVNTEDRVVVYAATTGGYVEPATHGLWTLTAPTGNLVNAGVYRYTSHNLKVYLPLVLRSYASQ